MLDDDDDYDEDEDDGCNNLNDDNNNDATTTMMDFFDHDPTIREKMEMRKATKPPSEWLNLLCREWANENQVLVETTDAKFLDYKPFLKGLISSQLLCRLSIPATRPLPTTRPATSDVASITTSNAMSNDFWEILGICDSFDRSYIVAQIERFCALYSIRAISLEDTGISDQMFANDEPDLIVANMPVSHNTAAAVVGNAMVSLQPYMDQPTMNTAGTVINATKLTKNQSIVIHKAVKSDAISAHEAEVCADRQNYRREQRRISIVRNDQKHRDKEQNAAKKAADRAVREAEREERRRMKMQLREQREKFAMEQKEAALKRAAELVTSNRVPIEITRGVAAAKAAQLAIQAGTLGSPPMVLVPPPETRKRSAVVVSTASDLHQIVIHSRNLWAKYNAIAREHNQKVSWSTVARELGVNVKVREKYARMHARAEERGFDWLNHGHWKIKEHPEIFLYPTADEQNAKMPPPPPNVSQTVTMTHDDAIAAAAAVVVDAAVTFQGSSNVGASGSQMQLDTASGTHVTDPISYNIDEEDNGMIESI